MAAGTIGVGVGLGVGVADFPPDELPVAGFGVAVATGLGVAVGTGVGVGSGMQYVARLGVLSFGSQGVAAEAVSTSPVTILMASVTTLPPNWAMGLLLGEAGRWLSVTGTAGGAAGVAAARSTVMALKVDRPTMVRLSGLVIRPWYHALREHGDSKNVYSAAAAYQARMVI